MTELEREIVKMYADIERYGGDFGDGVCYGSYDPWAMVQMSKLTPFEKTGVSVALLCYLQTAIDNSTYTEAVEVYGPAVESIIDNGLFHEQPFAKAAAAAFFVSETAFNSELKSVYENVVRPYRVRA